MTLEKILNISPHLERESEISDVRCPAIFSSALLCRSYISFEQIYEFFAHAVHRAECHLQRNILVRDISLYLVFHITSARGYIYDYTYGHGSVLW